MASKLTVVEQREVQFYGDELTAVRASDGHVYVSVRHMCDALGLDRPSQVRRIKRSEVLADGYKGDVKMTSPGGIQEVGVLRVDLVPLWLTGLRVNIVKEEIQPKLKRFQREAAKVLWEAFQEGRLTAEPAFDELLESDSPAAQAYKMLQAMMQLARNQVLLEARLDEQGQKLLEYGQRIEDIEATLGVPERYITREQASRLSQAVRAIGLILTKRSGTSEYGRVYGELYRRFEISAYRELPAGKYEEAMAWLNEWRQSLVDGIAF